jgi:sugar lactone lactonase YvrE
VNSSNLYWTDQGDGTDGTIWEANLDGSNPHEILPTQIAGTAPAGLAVNSSHLYWADQGAGTIHEAGLDGFPAQVIDSGQNGPRGLAVDSSHLYWADLEGGVIMQANLDGTSPQVMPG